MRVSVIIATSNRAASLRVTLDALRQQTYRDFEVVVVQGPCTDETPALLAERASELRVVENPERNLCKSRNLGIDLAAGDVVAFIDDDGIPEPRWIEELVAAYDDEKVGGAGGLVYDQTGVNLQYRYAVCDRVGRTDFNVTPPLDAFNTPGADPFVYLQGTNMSFRREALEAVGGFDENIEYIWDESDLALHLIDAGWQLQPLDGAAVHHKMLPSNMRRGKGVVTDPFVPVKNRSYFALRNGVGKRSVEEVFRSLIDYLDLLREWAEDSERWARFTAREARHFVERMEAGFDAGVAQGMSEPRAGRRLAERDPAAFLPYPVRAPEGRRLAICLASLDYPPGPMGGIARYTVDLARGMAAAGHEVHVVTRAEPPQRLDFEDGVWVHRHPEGERLLPELDAHPLRDNLAHVAAVWRAVDEVESRTALDVVCGNVWLAETILCALDPRWATVMTCSTPIRTIAATQPAVAAKPHTAWQVKIEDAAVVRAAHLQPVSSANLETIKRETPGAAERPATVVGHGMVDRAGGPLEPPRGSDDVVELLFVGRLEPRKGIDTLLDAAIDLLRERPQLRLRLVGADNPYATDDPRPYAARLDSRLAAEPELRARILCDGEVDDATLDERLAGCDVFVAPSRYESFGLMNVEAMMFSRPVVSSRVGGIPEVVADGETGMLVEVDDVEGLREALRALADDPELRKRMGAAGRRRFEREFDNGVAVERMLALFGAVLEQHPGATTDRASAERAVNQGLQELLGELGEVEHPAEAADELLDRDAFPHDYLAAMTRLAGASDFDFVAGLYDAILRREPEPGAVEATAVALGAGAKTRFDVAREMATSDEAKLLGVDPSFLERLGGHDPSELERRVRDAFWRDDETFASLLGETLLGGGPDVDALSAEVTGSLRNGGTRRAALEELIARRDVRERLPHAAALGEAEFLTSDELVQRLHGLAEGDDDAFVGEAYRLLLGREPDEGGASGHRSRLAVASRRTVLVEMAQSEEAQRRGVDPVVVDTAAAQVPALSAVPPPQGLARVPGAGRARRVGRRVLRDPQVAELRAELERQTAAQQASVRELTTHLARSREAEALERLMTEVQALDSRLSEARALEARLTELSFQIATQQHGLSDLVETSANDLKDLVREHPVGTHGAYLGNGRMLITTLWGGKLLAPADDLSLTPELVAHGVYEAPFTNYLRRSLEPGHTVIDVGANIGMYTVLAASCIGAEGRVIAYEPNPDVGTLLRENVSLNWFNDRVTVKAAAASDRAGTVSLHVTERFMGNSSLLEPSDAYFKEAPMDTTRVVEVEAEPLDALADELDEVELVKIDVEGAEHLVLEGMAGLIGRGAVRTVAFEVYRERMGGEWDRFCALLRGYEEQGWQFHLVGDEGGLEASDLEPLLAVGRFAQVVMTRP